MEKLKRLHSIIKPSIRGSRRSMGSDSGGDPYHSLYQTTFMEYAAKSGINQGLSHVGDDGQVWSLTQFRPGLSTNYHPSSRLLCVCVLVRCPRMKHLFSSRVL